MSKAVKHPEYVPDIDWKNWTQDNLPKSRDFWVSDIDTFIRTRQGCTVLVEIKRKGVKVPTWQKMSYGLLAAVLKYAEGETLSHDYLPYDIKIGKFLGIVELIFDNTWFDDGDFKVNFNGIPQPSITESALITLLSFDEDCCICFPPDSCDCNCN